MSDTAIEKRRSTAVKEKAQYAAALGIIGVMLWVAGFPVFLLFFVGILTFFVWKVFSSEGRNETRRIFEFYLSANEILREDDRRWYGFEIQEAISRGEHIVRSMSAPPPLVSFALGALYQKLDDHSSAVKFLSQVVDDSAVSETAIVYPSKELRDYVRMLRKIERAPAEAPLTSSAIRALERARKNRGEKLLELSREQLPSEVKELPESPSAAIDDPKTTWAESTLEEQDTRGRQRSAPEPDDHSEGNGASRGERKTISEVLHDIYDSNVQ